MAAEWYYAKDKKIYGPLEAAELKRLAATGELSPNDLIRKTNMQQWVRASSAKQLFASRSPITASDSSCSAVQAATEQGNRSIPVFGNESQLPATVAGLSLERVEVYPETTLGACFRYGSLSTAIADAYMYTYGQSCIPETLDSEQVVSHFKESAAAVIHMAETGRYLDFEVLGSERIFLPPSANSPLFLWTAFSYSTIPAPGVVFTGRRVSHLAMRVDCAHYNKVRYTDYIQSDADQFVGLLQFMSTWTAAVQAVAGSKQQSPTIAENVG